MIVQAEAIGKSFAAAPSWASLFGAKAAAPRRVLDSVSFQVKEGEIFGLLGPNGAGKTTLFKILATLLVPDEGEASIGGHSVRDEGARARGLIAPVLANERSLYWRLNAGENLRLYAVLQGVPRAQIDSEIKRVLAATGLSDAPASMVGTFSSGMRQRLLIARALLGRPRVLLLDEPTRSLDPLAARDFRRFLRDSVVRAEGCTVLLATHDADDAWDLCDRVAVLHKGKLLATDETERLRTRFGGAQHSFVVDSAQAKQARELLSAGGVAVVRESPQAAALAELIERVIADAGASAA